MSTKSIDFIFFLDNTLFDYLILLASTLITLQYLKTRRIIFYGLLLCLNFAYKVITFFLGICHIHLKRTSLFSCFLVTLHFFLNDSC